MRRIRVIQLLSGIAVGDQSGGAEQIGIHLARLLDKDDFESFVFAMRGYDSPSEKQWLARLTQEGIPVYGLEPMTGSTWHDVRHTLRSLWRVVEEVRPDVISSHSERGDMINVWLKWFHPVHPRAVRVMHTDQQWQTHPRIGPVLLQGLYPLAFDAEIGVSRVICDVLKRRPLAQILRREPILCYPGIDADVLRRLADRSRPRPAGLPDARPLIGIVGRLAPQKGHVYLLEALPIIRQVLPAHLLIIGTGPLEADLRTRAMRLGIGNSAHFLGSRSDVLDILPHLDLLVSASLWEGLATVILEAMAAGVPVVATDVSGSREIVTTGQTGILVPVADPMALAQAAITMLSNTSEARRMAHNALGVAARFTVQNAVPCYAAVYRQVIGPKNLA